MVVSSTVGAKTEKNLLAKASREKLCLLVA